MSVEVTFEMVDILLCTGGNIYVRCPENDADAVMILFRERIRKFCILCIYRVSIYVYMYLRPMAIIIYLCIYARRSVAYIFGLVIWYIWITDSTERVTIYLPDSKREPFSLEDI